MQEVIENLLVVKIFDVADMMKDRSKAVSYTHLAIKSKNFKTSFGLKLVAFFIAALRCV